MAVALPFYNAFVGLGVALAIVMFQRRLRVFFDTPSERDRAMLLLLVALPASVVGAWAFDRVAGAASGPVLPVRGLAFYGGLLAALVSVIALAPLLGLRLRRLLDAGAPAIALGHAIGRIGCGVAGCCYGRPVDPHGVLHALGLTRIPTQWLESFALAGIALWLSRRVPCPCPCPTCRHVSPAPPDANDQPTAGTGTGTGTNAMISGPRDGDVIALYFASYGAVRLVLETLRDDSRGTLPGLPAWLSPSQWISVALLLAAGALAATRDRRSHREVSV